MSGYRTVKYVSTLPFTAGRRTVFIVASPPFLSTALVAWLKYRLGRSLSHLLKIVDESKARGVQFASIQDGFDTLTPASRQVFSVIGANVSSMNNDLTRLFPQLETGRLRLRQATSRDGQDIYAVFTDPKVTEFHNLATFESADEALRVIISVF